MSTRKENQRPARRGIAFVITLIFLALFACLAVAIAATADANLTIAHNRIEGQEASALAGTGIQLMQFSLGGMAASGAIDAAGMHNLMRSHLQTDFAGSNMINTANITSSASGVAVPTITLTRADGRMGTVDVSIHASAGSQDKTTVTVTSAAHYGAATRTATYNMTIQRGGGMPPFAVASKSPISMTGNAVVRGLNNPHDGDVLSASYSTTNAVNLTGNVRIGGSVTVVNPDGRISKTGNVTIGGDQIIGANEPQWPEVDITDFKQYATNVRSSGGSGDLTLSNIRIPPNTNPTFSGNMVVRGVVYIQAPNKVTFSGNTTIIGCIVADQPTTDNLTANQIKFTGNVMSSGVENLPADAQYDGLRDMTGSFLLAPGFSTQFTGNFGTVNGCMIASEFKFTGNAGGTVKGGVVNLRDSSFQVTGNANLIIDREGAVEEPAGVVSSTTLVCVSGSYAE